MVNKPARNPDREYGLIVQQPGKTQQALAKSLMMILNYRYGLNIRSSPIFS